MKNSEALRTAQEIILKQRFIPNDEKLELVQTLTLLERDCLDREEAEGPKAAPVFFKDPLR